ncbi:MAG: PhzF family phenazine biosynthesis protein [Clostridiales bacterium]|jgi:predicted PhzF superfamily epimerase YddE/YHI9|nr:PhzF family phenazine biosynthesis protein [Clostridiales bacterium]
MKIYQVDAFTNRLFSGNPAGVCLIYGSWMPVEIMQNIAAEINLPETAFVLAKGGELFIRWFTPTTEVPLCGHATLAAAHVLFKHEGFREREIIFRAGENVLKVAYEGDLLVLDFPAAKIWQIDPCDMVDCFNFRPKEVWRSEDEYMLVFENQKQVEGAVCNLGKAAKIDLLGLIITSPGIGGMDFVSRYFAPKIGIDEDPVTGSAHTLLVPYWREVLGKEKFRAAQLSKRGGDLYCAADGARVKIGGRAVTFLIGEICL